MSVGTSQVGSQSTNSHRPSFDGVSWGINAASDPTSPLASSKMVSPARSVTPSRIRILPRLIDRATKTNPAKAAVAPEDATRKSDHPALFSILHPGGTQPVECLLMMNLGP